MARKRKPEKQKQLELPTAIIEDASLADETRRRYLSYALSVITSRALPDVRDGLKPVQRRILYTMENELHLRHDVKYRKSAAIVGDVMGKFHPHGDTAIYDALARMAQPFSMRLGLVDGRGNFGSPDGDPPAAMRYTEARLSKLAGELMAELGQRTVAFRPNYDGTRFEPIVLPARFPNLLVNGSYGIAVGMATSIPPHNLGEIVDACIAMIDEPDISVKKLLKKVKGPDFPTGGELLCRKDEIEAAYTTGQGSLKLRGTFKVEEGDGRKKPTQIVIDSIPYAVERRVIVEKIADVIRDAKKLPVLVDVRDESTDDCRIVCEIKKDANPQLVMAYLYKHTPLAQNVQINLTCLVPTANPEIAAPQRVDLRTALRCFLDFRMEVVVKRLEFQLEQVLKRIHILEGFEIVFDALDETIRIIRRSDGRKDAAEKLMKRFGLDEVQVDAILELRLYKLAKLEILLIREELEAKRAEAKRLQKLLKSETERWKLIRAELHELRELYPDIRRTKIVGEVVEPEFDENAFIVDEDAMVVLTQQGWVKRQQRVKDVAATRVREGDAVFEVVAGSTRAAVAFFSNQGACYVCRINDVPATTGYGVPVQTLFKLDDGERIVAMMGFDPRFFEVPPATEGATEPEEPYAVAVSRQGNTLRFSLRPHREPSTRAGRKYTRPKDGDEILFVSFCEEGDNIACATKDGRALICPVSEISVLQGAGRGVMLVKLQKGDSVVGAAVLGDDDDMLVVENANGTAYEISTRKYEVVSRAGKGFSLFKRGKLERVVWGEPTLPGFPTPDE
jgi:DNA gyrase subunit A